MDRELEISKLHYDYHKTVTFGFISLGAILSVSGITSGDLNLMLLGLITLLTVGLIGWNKLHKHFDAIKNRIIELTEK